MTIELLVRGRFVDLPGATATPVAGNGWSIRIPDPGSSSRRTRRGPALEDWDGAVFALDGEETQPGVGTGGGADHVLVTVWV